MRKTLIQCGVSLLIAPVLTLMLLGTVALAVGSSDGVSRSAAGSSSSSSGSGDVGSGGGSSSSGGSGSGSQTPTPTPPTVTFTLDKTSISLKVGGDSEKLTATYTENGTTVSKPVTWTSSASSVATVDNNGRVKAVGEGTATITAMCEGKTATCTVTVSPADVPDATVTINNKGPFTIDPNGTASVTVTPTPGTEEVKWKFVGETGDQDIDDTDIVSLSKRGNTWTITGREPGELRMYAYVGDGSGANQRTDTITITVSGIVVDTKPIELQENQILPLPEAKAYGTAASGAVKYVVSDGYIAQVVKGNSVKGYTPGSTAIIVSDQKNIYKVSIPLTVVNDPSTTIEYSRTLRSGEALSFKELSSDFRSQLGEIGRASCRERV